MKEHNDNLLKFFALKLLAPMIWAMFVPIHFMFLGEIFQKQSPKPRPATLLKTRFWHRCFRPATMLKKRLWHMCFPVNFAKFLRTLFLQNTSGDCFCSLILTFENIINHCNIELKFQYKGLRFVYISDFMQFWLLVLE